MRRILALEGGGLRGVVEVAFLERIETLARERRGGHTRLCDLFDLVGGTSTGAILATCVAVGLSAEDMKAFYLHRAAKIFRSSPLRVVGLRPAYDGNVLEAQFRAVLGQRTLGDDSLRSYLAIVLKRVDTGAPWIVSNIPSSPYFDDPPDGAYMGNRHYSLARLLRASAAAPGFFSPVKIKVHERGTQGIFLDGGVSPYNDPSLALLMLARLSSYGLEWPTGANELFILSVGCGSTRRLISEKTAARSPQLAIAALALVGMVNDTEQHTLQMMQALGRPLAPMFVNSEVGDMQAMGISEEPLFSYQRLSFPLTAEGLSALGVTVTTRELDRLRAIDDPKVVGALYDIGCKAAARYVTAELVDALVA